ncbi:MAG: formate dehydrogenase accessory protein FdhE [Syntrophus sp. PtaB.Bin001]|nr:MAG: formate dehydrogenase accessory protein FdhE [Syntrophus sp. PtaB.Bin001]
MKSMLNALKTIEQYKTDSPHYSELLDILAELLILRENYHKTSDKTVFQVDEHLIPQKMAGGLPLIDFISGKFDFTLPRNYFLQLLEIAGKRSPEKTQEMVAQLQSGVLDFEKMVRHTFDPFSEEEYLEEKDDDFLDLVELFLEESLRPELEKIAGQYGEKISKLGWSEGYCPICGKEPKIGEIKADDGRRYLFCNQCGFEWHYRRVKCPFCGNEEQHALAYFTIEGDERYRVDVCNVCKRYIKMVDLRNSERETNLDVEDIATLHLDMLAYEEGYS